MDNRQSQLNELFRRVCPERLEPVSATAPGPDRKKEVRSAVRGPANLSDQEILTRAFGASNGEAFRALWNGDTSAHGGDDSAADLALCNHLAYWTGKDAHRMDGLFRQSHLMRPKWDEVHGAETYGAMTIKEAIAGTVNIYDQSYGLNRDRDSVNGNGHEPGRNRSTSSAPVNEDPDSPNRLACLFMTDPGYRSLYWWREEWYTLDQSDYRTVSTSEITAKVTRSILIEFARLAEVARSAWERNGRQGVAPTARKITVAIVSNVILALKSMCFLPDSIEPPCWLGQPGPPPREILVCQNGLIHLPACTDTTKLPTIMPATPDFFCLNALPFDFPDQLRSDDEPAGWLEFLSSVWPEDNQSIETLQDWFGYCLLPDTSQEKILMILGPKRSGKGTICTVLQNLIGLANTVNPTLGSLGFPFGLQPLLGKTLAVVADARLSNRTDSAVIVERLLSISGQDLQTVDRKHLSSVSVRLSTRFVISTNELPRFMDASGALTSRLLLLRMERSWINQEDIGLKNRLLHELPMILLWALEGWHRLRGRGRFVQPESALPAVQDMEDLGSPIGAFFRDCCEQGDFETSIREVYDRWKDWCESRGHKPSSEQTFGRDLRSVLPAIKTKQTRLGAVRARVFVGVKLRDRYEDVSDEETASRNPFP